MGSAEPEREFRLRAREALRSSGVILLPLPKGSPIVRTLGEGAGEG